MQTKIIPWGTKLLEYFCSTWYPFIRLYSQYYRGIVQQEIQFARITANDRVLCIGGGPVPATALLIAQLTGAVVEVLDHDEQAVHRARLVIQRLGLAGQVKAIHGSGESIPRLADFTVVHLAVQLTDKVRIIEHLQKEVAYGTRILIRVPRDGLLNYYPGISAREITLPYQFYPYTHKTRNVKGTILIDTVGNHSVDHPNH